MNARSLFKPRLRIEGAMFTDLVTCDHVTGGQLLAGYDVEADGTLLLTHLEANGMDIFQLAMEVPKAIAQIEERLKADFWTNQLALDAERRAEAIYEGRRA